MIIYINPTIPLDMRHALVDIAFCHGCAVAPFKPARLKLKNAGKAIIHAATSYRPPNVERCLTEMFNHLFQRGYSHEPPDPEHP